MEELCGEKHLILEGLEPGAYRIVPQTVQGLQKPHNSDHGDQPFKEQLGSGPLGASHRSDCPSAQRHSFRAQASKAGFRAHTRRVVRVRGLSFLVYLQRVALQDQLLEKTFRDLQQKPLSL